MVVKSCKKNYIVHYIINANHSKPRQVFKYRHTRTPLAGDDLDLYGCDHNIVKTKIFTPFSITIYTICVVGIL